MGIPIREFELPKKFDANIEIAKRFPGEVAEYECREAAVYVHVSWREWLEMDHMERALAVAHYRVSSSIKANVEDAAEKASRRKANRAKRRTAAA